MNRTTSFIFSALCMCNTTCLISAKSLASRVKGIFVAEKKHTDTVHKEFAVKKGDIVTISGINGNITVNTAWDHNKIVLEAHKTAATPEDLKSMSVKCTLPNATSICVATKHISDKTQGTIDYTCIVPADIQLNLETESGSIVVKEVAGIVNARTTRGSIEAHEVKNNIHASTSQGAIKIYQPGGKVHATTENGAILITDAQDSIVAETDKGAIDVHCKRIDPTGSLTLSSKSGLITLRAPADQLNADLQAKTERGIITSEHQITLKPVTTPLNKQAWQSMKRDINGTLGTGEATIQLSSINSNIKLVETRTT